MSVVPFTPDYQVDDCTGKTQNLPALNLAGLSNSFHSAKQAYRFFFANSTAVRAEQIIQYPLTVTKDMRLNLHLGAAFSAGITATLTKIGTNGTANTTYDTVTTEYNGLRMSTTVNPGQSYLLTLKTGPFQMSLLSTSTFPLSPRCVFFDFELSLEPALLVSMVCEAASVPTSLDGPQYLGASNRVHFQDRFLLPTKAVGFDAEETISFKVRTQSQVRAYAIENVQGGISFSILEDGALMNAVKTEDENEGEVSLYTTLSPQKSYVFKILYYNMRFNNITRCSSWNLEFEIAPIPEGISTEVCGQEKAPLPYLSTVFSNTYQVQELAFSQNSSAYRAEISFTVWSYAYFRALVFFDFVWGDLTLKLVTNNDTIITIGENDYNKNEIPGVQLPFGTYTLVITETLAQSRVDIRRCVEYTLMIGVVPITASTAQPKPQDFTGCPYLGLPSSFDSISYLSAIGGNMFHFSRDVRMDVKAHGTKTLFHVKEPSYLRLLVPPHEIDIDVYLYSVDENTEEATQIASSWGYAEESIFKQLNPGLYQIKFTFLAHFQTGGAYPDPDACIVFTLELAVAPVTFVDQKLLLPSNTPTTTFPDTLKLDEDTAVAIVRSTAPMTHKMKFTTFIDSLFQANVLYPFIPGGVYFSLEGGNITSPFLSSPSSRTWSANVGEGVAFFDLVLYPGDYQLVITDKANYSTTAVTKILLEYNIQEGVSPPNYCDDADTLPKDLFTKDGGSKPYGGPQADDGAVRISGSHFIVPEANTHNYITFKILNTSWVRFWAATPGDNNDIDFMLWRNESKKDLIEAAVGIDSAESQLTLLQPQAEPYLLDVYIFQRSKVHCSYATFMFAIEPNVSAFSRLRCPSPLPNPPLPPATILVDHTSLVNIYSEDFVITKDFMDSHLEQHWSYNKTTYSINITVKEGYRYSLWTMIGYDFTLTDFSLTLVNENGTSIGQSSGAPPFAIDSFVTFETWLSAEITPGKYVLKISEKIYRSRVVHAGECDRFAFMFNTQYLGPTNGSTPVPAPAGNPQITAVVPPSGSQLDASEPLVVQILFSEPLNSSVPLLYEALRNWIKNHSLAYLQDLDGTTGNKLWPAGASFNAARSQLSLSFYPVTFGHTYSLHLDPTSAVSASGSHYSYYIGAHTYSMLSCSCGGHGVCAPNATHIRQCTCEFPYAGPECQTCHDGYYRSGSTCERNIPCTASSCNGHGTCDDTKGFPQCKCNEGYESNGTTLCGQCRSGYQGYPNCTKKSDDRKTRCTAPLLPTDLGTVSFLHSPPALDVFHIQGEYFIDMDHIEHDMAFSLTEDSILRVYTEPHAVDIDLWLWRLSPTEKDPDHKEYIASGVSYNEEETFFQLLPGGGDYVLSFHFIPTSAQVDDCPTFNLALAIASVTQFNAEVNRIKPDCPANNADDLPKIDIPQNLVPTTGLTFESTHQFAVSAIDNPSKGSRIFQTINFTIPKLTGSKVAVITMELGQRFLIGNIAAKLHRTNVNNTVVSSGFNGYNAHLLNHYMQEGNYSLVFYLPVDMNRSLTPCAPFTLKLSIKFTDEDEDIFNCNHPRLPASLNTAQYNGRKIHLFDSYLVEESTKNVEFIVSEPSYVRLSASSAQTSFIVFLARKETSNSVDRWITMDISTIGGEVSASLTNGTYRFSFDFGITFFSGSFFDTFCPTIEVELAIAPKADFKNYTQRVSCPQGSVNKLPQIPSRFITLPYSYNGGSSTKEGMFYVFSHFGSLVSTHRFEIFETAFIDVGVAAHFLTGNLELQLRKNEGGLETNSIAAQEDYTYIRQELSPGNYTLTISQEAVITSSDLPCTPFTFQLSLTSIAAYKNADPCWASKLIPLPTSLNSMRYMSILEDTVTLQSDSWRIPTLTLNHQRTLTNFTLKTQSVFRIYVEDNTIDIDVHLHKADTGTEIIGGSGQFDEESFVTVLPAGDYYVRFEFYNWGSSQPNCGKFAMQLAIAPVTSLPPIDAHCPSSAVEVFPQIPDTISELTFSAGGATSDYHYQQTDQTGFGKPIFTKKFTVQAGRDPINIHVELGYNFVITDIVIKLETTGQAVSHSFVGSNEFHRNVLSVKNVPQGAYTLTLAEAAPSTHPLIVGCSHFTFSMIIGKAKSAVSRIANSASPIPLPPHLDTISYLKYAERLHLARTFSVNSYDFQTPLSFTLKSPSLVRIGVPTDGLFGVGLQPTSGLNIDHTIATVFQPGNHTVYFYLQNPMFSDSVSTNMEIAIEPITSIQKTVDHNLKCASTLATTPTAVWQPPQVVVRPDGTFLKRDKQAFLTAQQISAVTATIYQIPFTVTADSVISAQLQYDFLLVPLQLSLTKGGALTEPTRYGTMRYNEADLNVQVTPGKYNLTIFYVRRWANEEGLLGKDSNNKNKELPCVDIDFLISISLLGSDDDRVDCSAYSLFPFDLNTDTGGSLGFGGPIKYGTLHLWHDKFLLNDNLKTMRSSFQIKNESMASLFVNQHAWSDLKASIRLVDDKNSSNLTSIVPITFSSSFFQWAGIYKLNSGNYYVELTYSPSIFEACSYFSLGLAIQPVKDVLEDLSQACNTVQPPLPPHKLTTNVLQSEGYFTTQNIQQTANLSTHLFSYEIEFTTTEGALLDVSLSFNSLASFFTIKLFRQSAIQSGQIPWEEMFEGQWDAIAEEKSYLGLTQQIEFSPPAAGSYRLVITHKLTKDNELPVFAGVPAATIAATKACFPYLLDFQVSSTGVGTIVRSVEPRGGPGYDPSSDIYIEIRFSGPLFTGAKDPITRYRNTEFLSKAVVLKPLASGSAPKSGTSSESTDITAEQITIPVNNPVPDDYTRWLFVFNHKSFGYGITYDLVLLTTSAPIYGSDGKVVSLLQQHRYAMQSFDVTCSGGNGVFNNKTTSCDCKPETFRTGLQCERCKDGYQLDTDTRTCVPLPVCAQDTCGCLPNSPAGQCQPMGSCSIIPTRTISKIRCDCLPQYSGNRCEACALGYVKYPSCTNLCPLCVNGNCSTATSTCVCNGNWAGPTCSGCAAGFSGANCDQKSDGLKVAGVIIGVLVVIALLAGGVWWFRFRKQRPEYIDDTLELELSGGKKVAGGGDPLAGLTDEEDDLTVPTVHDDDDDDDHNGEKDKEKETLVKLDDFEPAKKTPPNLLS